ncbi:alpha-(1-_6)-mannopyranosyltransferase A [Speluncibacter jeojiensis]|uniref:Alpha-(1->6)-mannopyranosyltransferase A n=1 Tax=Speluncibacter jeojiensis TaxID=2710754 RepID=A0A9X4RCV0_9ACTN|nr:alpha-(1->6)-mannopyranosyltransferase A [Corynebacteriales bacterium D3-21]
MVSPTDAIDGPGADQAPLDRSPLRSLLRGGLRRDALLGFVGACLITFGGFGSGALRERDPLLESMHLSWLRYGHGQVLSAIALWAGVLMMITAWVRLGRSTMAGRVALRDLRWILAMWIVPLLISVPVFSRDAYSYLAQGALLRDGFNPYKVGPVVNPGPLLENVSTIWTTTTAPYGPVFIMVARLVTTITGNHVVAGVLLLRLAMLPGLALAVWAIPRLARRLGGSPAVAVWLAVLNPLVLIHLIGGVHNEMLMVGLLTAGIAAVLERKHVLGIAIVTVAVAVKATAGVALPFLVWMWMVHRREDAEVAGEPQPNWLRSFARTAGASIAIFVVVFGAASLAAGVGLGWVNALAGSNKIINWLTLPTILGHVVTWFSPLGLMSVLPVTRLICEIAFAVIFVVLVVRFRHTTRQAMIGIVLAMTAVVTLSPAALPWYYSWPLAMVAGLALSPRVLATLVGLSTWLMVIFQPDGSIGMYQWGHVILTTAAAILAAVSLRREDPLHLRALWPPRTAAEVDAAGSDTDTPADVDR